MNDTIKAAVIYHYWAHYRRPICHQLCQQSYPNPEYVLYSDNKSNNDIKTIDPRDSKVSVHEGGLRWRFVRNFWITKDIMWQSGLIRLALSKKYDAIIYLGQVYFISTWVSALIARITGKRVLMWTHGFIEEEKNIKGRVRTIFYKLADGILLYGNRARNIMVEKGFPPDQLYVIYNSLNYNSQKSIREKVSENDCEEIKKALFSEPDLPALLFVGRLTPQKKLDMLIKAAHVLEGQDMRVNIIFVGEGKEEERLRSLADAVGIGERIRFIGPCYEEEKLSKLIMAADICVAPGEVGLTAMHSLAYGTPVITHNNFSKQMPEYEAVQEGISGLFFQYGDCEDLAKQIKNWLTNKKSKSNIRKQCIEIIEKYYNPDFQCKIMNNAVLGHSAEL